MFGRDFGPSLGFLKLGLFGVIGNVTKILQIYLLIFQKGILVLFERFEDSSDLF